MCASDLQKFIQPTEVHASEVQKVEYKIFFFKSDQQQLEAAEKPRESRSEVS